MREKAFYGIVVRVNWQASKNVDSSILLDASMKLLCFEASICLTYVVHNL